MVRIDVEQASADSSGDGAPAVVFDRVSVLESAAEPAWFDLELVSSGGGPSVEDGVEGGASNSWRGEVCQFGQVSGGFDSLPGRCVFPYVGRGAVVFGVVVESPSGEFLLNSGGGIL